MLQIAEGEMIPRGFGVAFMNHYSNTAVCAPWGLHFLIGAWHQAWSVMRGWRFPDQWETHRRYWESKGYAAGRLDGQDFAARIFRDLAREKGWEYHIPGREE